MNTPIIDICYLGAVFSRRARVGNSWQTVQEWEDVGHVANLLVKSGYESEHLPALELLNAL